MIEFKKHHETEHILGNLTYKILVKYDSETNQVKDHRVKWIQNLDLEPYIHFCVFNVNLYKISCLEKTDIRSFSFSILLQF